MFLTFAGKKTLKDMIPQNLTKKLGPSIKQKLKSIIYNRKQICKSKNAKDMTKKSFYMERSLKNSENDAKTKKLVCWLVG